MEAFKSSLAQKLAENNIDLPAISKLVDYADLLVKDAQFINLTSILTANEIASKHFLDSLFGEQLICKNAKVIDIGCGAGFPSLPIAIVRKDINFTLVEATTKKTDFLKKVVDTLALSNVEVVNARAECLAKIHGYANAYDYAISRAVARLNILLELSAAFLKIGGRLIAYKAAKAEEELLEAQTALHILQLQHVETKEFVLDNQFKRNLIIVAKKQEILGNYPRSYNKIKSKPL